MNHETFASGRAASQDTYQGCDQLPSKRAGVNSLRHTIDNLVKAIDRIEGRLRQIQGQPASPETDREKTILEDKNTGMRNEMYVKSRKLSAKIDELRNIESRCSRTA